MISLINRTRYNYKNASTARTTGGVNIFISYQTIIAAEAPGVTFITSRNYSTTTAHHKTDARRWFNNSRVIEVTPEALYNYVDGSITAADIIKEQEKKDQLLELIKLNFNPRETAWRNDLPDYYSITQLLKELETGNDADKYKNGNSETRHYYRTRFKYVSNINFKITRHYFRFKYAAKACEPNWTGKPRGGTGTSCKYKAVITSW